MDGLVDELLVLAAKQFNGRQCTSSRCLAGTLQ